MRANRVAIICSFLLVASVGDLLAHSLKTATGYSVSHLDASSLTGCSQTRCPVPDSNFEKATGFRSYERVYPNSFRWNCHGRTFDARRSWTSYADSWFKYDGSYCPASPKPGHTIMWWENGKTSHTVTIVGTWKGLDTIVMSKYGAQGQYKHALRNAIALYKANWSVIGFSAGTQIYSGSHSQPAKPAEDAALTHTAEDFLLQRERMPWYKDVLASQVLADIEHSRLVARAGALTTAARERVSRAESNEDLVAVLLGDLRDVSHFGLLGAYNSPEFTEDYISAIESGKLLARLASTQPQLRSRIIAGLFDITSDPDPGVQDYARGTAVHVLRNIMTRAERKVAREELRFNFEAAKSRTEVAPTYLEYYLGKL